MRSTLAVVALLGTAALAQDSARPRPVGSALLDALPPQADLVVATPDLPALLGAATKAGLGSAEAWRTAFDAQLTAWGAPTGRPERLVAGSHAFLDAADGEAIVAAIPLKTPGKGAARATLIAFRTTRDDKTLRAAFQDLTHGGLWLRWDGTPRDEEIAGRAVVTLPSGFGSLHAVLGGGLVAVCDHPLALGLFLSGLAEGKPGAAPSGDGQLRLTVRRGRGDAAWEGYVWGERETVQFRAPALRTAHVPAAPSESLVLAVADAEVGAPLFPSGCDPRKDPRELKLGGGMETYVALDGALLAGGVDDKAYPACAGGAWRLGWLRAFAGRRLATPIPDIDAKFLAGPLASAVTAAGKSDGEFVAWTSKEPGRLAGPFGHGPATFLALRTLHDIARGLAPHADPGESVTPPPVGAPRGGAPLPAPTEPRDR